MSDSLVYLDSSAFVKMIIIEAESAELERFLLNDNRLTSSELLETEARRAVMRIHPRYKQVVQQQLISISLIGVSTDILVTAGFLEPVGLRSLDAIHLATALTLGDDLGVIVTYDLRMAEAARNLGLRVQTPGSRV